MLLRFVQRCLFFLVGLFESCVHGLVHASTLPRAPDDICRWPRSRLLCYLRSMEISDKWPLNPRDSAAQFFLPFVFIVGGFAFLTGFFHLLAGENPVGPVAWFVTESWSELSPLVLFLFAVWGFHFVSYLLVGSFVKDLFVVARSARRLACAFWRRFLSSWTGPALILDLKPSLLLVRLFRQGLPTWLAVGWRPGDSVQLE